MILQPIARFGAMMMWYELLNCSLVSQGHSGDVILLTISFINKFRPQTLILDDSHFRKLQAYHP